jgi:hypothetical protein
MSSDDWIEQFDDGVVADGLLVYDLLAPDLLAYDLTAYNLAACNLTAEVAAANGPAPSARRRS